MSKNLKFWAAVVVIATMGTMSAAGCRLLRKSPKANEGSVDAGPSAPKENGLKDLEDNPKPPIQCPYGGC